MTYIIGISENAICPLGNLGFKVAQGPLKVSKSRKHFFKFSFEPKNERKYFCISALASKNL